MDYDVDMHLPQRLENFFQGLESGNFEMAEEAFDSIKQLESVEFNEKFKVLEDEYESDVKGLQSICFKNIREGVGVKNFEDMIKTIDDCESSVKRRSIQFGKDVKRFLIKWNQQKQGNI